jgi:adenine-specific DNA-methyltransferase
MMLSAKEKLFEEVLTKPFSLENFLKFSNNFFNQLEIVSPYKMREDGWNWSEFAFHIKGYYHIANFYADGDKMAVFAVELKNYKNLDRARSMQRNFIKKLILAGGIDAAIVAFYAEGETKWRLSFIKVTPELTPQGLKDKITPAKRYSYLVGKGEPCHTAKERLFYIFINERTNPSIEKIEEAFSVETVTKEFYNQYAAKYHDLIEHLENNDDFNSEAKRLHFTSEQFAKKLMGQLAFLYFIQKKGWLGVNAFPPKLTTAEYKKAFYRLGKASREVVPKVYKQTSEDIYARYGAEIDKLSKMEQETLANSVKGQPWGMGPRDFIRKLFKVCVKEGNNFFDDYLEPLFYEGLNKKRGANDYFVKLKCRIPFLNGGLFEPLDNYDWNGNNFKIPNWMFSNIDEKEKDYAEGILDIFDRYNFTMNEDEPLEKEVAVDPEMLGKIFENLLDVKDRKSKGAFYTPREVVHYMCQESLINYLVNETGISYEAIKNFIIYGEFMKDEDTTHEVKTGLLDMNISKEILDLRNSVNRLKEIDNALANVKVADPAVGSGAFPLGMVSEIVRARRNITEYYAMLNPNKYEVRMMYESERHPLILKLHTIKNSIFAVDIEPSAVDIAKLRLWLSLVVEQETDENAEDNGIEARSRNPRPLPNLECHIMCGNSLIDEIDGIRLVNESELLGDNNSELYLGQSHYESLIKQLIEAQDRLFYAKNHTTKEEIKLKIKALKDKITRYNFNIKGASLETIEKYEKTKDNVSLPYFVWELDFVKTFKEKGGFDIVIGNPPYGAKFDRIMKKYLVDKYPNVPDFESADYFVCKSYSLLKMQGTMSYIIPNTILANLFAKKLREEILDKWSILSIDNLSNIEVFLSATVRNCILSLEKSQQSINNIKFVNAEISHSHYNSNNYKAISKDLLFECIDSWLNIFYQDEETIIIINKLRAIKDKLSTYTDISQGLIPYDKYRGHSPETIKNRIWHSDNKKDETYKKELQGRDLNRYYLKWNGKKWISYGKWLAAPRKPEFFRNERILIREITNPRILANYTQEEYYNSPSIINVINFKEISPFYILGIINSKLLSFYHNKTSPKANKGLFPKILVNDVRNLPIKHQEGSLRDTLIEKVKLLMDKIEDNELQDINDIDEVIDKIVYQIYNLNDEEIETVEKYFEKEKN